MTNRLEWPHELDRTDERRRSRTTKFNVTLGNAINDIKREMGRLDVDNWRLETAMPQRKTDGLPYASAAEPEDPGVALLWTDAGDDYAIACDKYTRVRDNCRAIGLYLNEKRKMQNRPVTTGQSEFATARLPAADDDAIVAGEAPHVVLGVKPDATDSQIKGAFREKSKTAHPDLGGSEAEFNRISDAMEAMLDG